MPSKTLIASALKPAGPVTLTCSPPPGSLTSERYLSTGSRIVEPLPSPLIELRISAVVPSRESWGWPNFDAAGKSSAFRRPVSALIRALSAAVSPPSRR